MKYKQSTKITRTITAIGIMAIVVIFIWWGLSAISSASATSATSSNEWEEFLTGTIIGVYPMISTTSCFGLFIEMDNGPWIRLWSTRLEGDWPRRNQKGIFYKKGKGKKRIFKWVVDESPPKTIAKKFIPKIALKPNNWKIVGINIPPINKTVLVRYINGKTITTAYINSKGEWKLETNRERVLGGKTIKDIKEWKEIPR